MFASSYLALMKFFACFLLHIFSLGDAGGHKILSVQGRDVVVYDPFQGGRRAGTKIPGIIVLTGSGETIQQVSNVGFEPLADQQDFLVIYPSKKHVEDMKWGFRSDIPFFSELATRLSQEDVAVDPSQLYVCGRSAGGTMSLYLQNEMDIFKAAAAVEAGIGFKEFDQMDMSRRGIRTLLIWNHHDPVLELFGPKSAPDGKREAALFDLTIQTLRRRGSTHSYTSQVLPTSSTVSDAKYLTFPEEAEVPELEVLEFRSVTGTHAFATMEWTKSFDAAQEVVYFFLGKSKSTWV